MKMAMMNAGKPAICIVDDDREFGSSLFNALSAKGYAITTFLSVEDFLSSPHPMDDFDLVISDINMPGKSGYDLCRIIRAEVTLGRLPIILMTGSAAAVEKSKGLDAGADDFVNKPFSINDLDAKIRSLLAIRAEEIENLGALQSIRSQYEELNSQLEREVRRGGQLEQLRRFLSPNIANLLTGGDNQYLLKPHRAEVTVLFVDLRRFTAFSEKVEPEEVLQVLGQYYTAVGAAAIKYRGTLGHLAGDGIMVFFNDPEPIPNHMEVAVKMAIEARKALMEQRRLWHEKQYDIDFGIGLSEGFATIGGIGFDRFSQYSVIGTVTNFASRLCDVADQGQILISERFMERLPKNTFKTEPAGKVSLKGIEKPVIVNSVLSVNEKTLSVAS